MQGKAVKCSIALFPERFPLQLQKHPQPQKVDKVAWVPSCRARVGFDMTTSESACRVRSERKGRPKGSCLSPEKKAKTTPWDWPPAGPLGGEGQALGKIHKPFKYSTSLHITYRLCMQNYTKLGLEGGMPCLMTNPRTGQLLVELSQQTWPHPSVTILELWG